jgi:hypothetical protein
MKFEISKKQIQPIHTNTEPTKYKLILVAEGIFFEIEWFEKQILKIGNKEQLKKGE